MKTRMNVIPQWYWIRLVAAILCPAIGWVAAQGADPVAMAGQYAANAKQNAALMLQYAWQMRVEVTLKGEPRPAQLYQMRFDTDGKPQKTLLSAPQEEPSGRGLRGRIKAKKIENFNYQRQ